MGSPQSASFQGPDGKRIEPQKTLEGADLPLFFCVEAFLTRVPIRDDLMQRRYHARDYGMDANEWGLLQATRIEAKDSYSKLKSEHGNLIKPVSDALEGVAPDARSPVLLAEIADSEYILLEGKVDTLADLFNRLLDALDPETRVGVLEWVQPEGTCGGFAISHSTTDDDFDPRALDLYDRFAALVEGGSR